MVELQVKNSISSCLG